MPSDSGRRQFPSVLVLGIIMVVVALVVWPLWFPDPTISGLDIDEPQQLKAHQVYAPVSGHIECSNKVPLSEMQVVVYVRGMKPSEEQAWRRSDVPCTTWNGKQWTLDPGCIDFLEHYSEFQIIAALATERDAKLMQSKLDVEDEDELGDRLYRHAYRCDNCTPCYSRSPVRIATRLPTTTPTSPTPDTPVPTPTTPTPTSTETPTPTNTPTFTPAPIPPTPTYPPPPVLLGIDLIGCNVTFKWGWSGTLAEDEYFGVRVGIGTPESVTWKKQADVAVGDHYEYTYSLPGCDAGDYFWQIVIYRGEPGESSNNRVLVYSEQGDFQYKGPVETPP